jgi:hypothetical protein
MSELETLVQIELRIQCGKCGSLLEADFSEPSRKTGYIRLLEISPCRDCLSEEYAHGQAEVDG